MGKLVCQIGRVGMAFQSETKNFHCIPISLSRKRKAKGNWDQELSRCSFSICIKQTCIPLAPCASVSGTGATPPAEILLDGKTSKKTKKIAGVDQDQLSDPKHLADPDSCFCEFKGVQIHYKVYNSDPQTQTLNSHLTCLRLPIILLHGFGASVFSWNRVMKPLSEVTASSVVAFDRPAFGLTSRVGVDSLVLSSPRNGEDAKPINPYSMEFSVLTTLYFVDLFTSDKAILVGHSAGSYTAVNSYFKAPERVAALILVAPAIFAPHSVRKVAEGNKLARDHNHTGRDAQNTNLLPKPFAKLFEVLSKVIMHIGQAMIQMVKGMTTMIQFLYKKALSSFLRSAFGVMLVRMVIDKFGIAAVRNAWYDSNRITEDVLNGYTRPLRAKGWDKALAEFTAATLASIEPESKPPLSKRLHEISCPVLIVTGDSDRIVPAWNAKRLSEAIPGSCFQVIKRCGHLPHEEKVEEFVSVVEKFLQRAFGDLDEMLLQTV